MAGTQARGRRLEVLAAARLKALTSLARTVDNALTALGELREQAEQRGAGGGRAARAAPRGGNSPWRPLYRRVGEVSS
jgi:hypothetical protein